MKTVFASTFGKFWMVALAAVPLAVWQVPAVAQQTGTRWVDPDSVPLENARDVRGVENGWSQAELAQLLAPVALYPDQLLAQVLTAATYPLEVAEAERWVSDPKNASLKGDRLARAIEDKDWSPSVKSLVPFPEVLHMMSSKPDWMDDLGEAFLAQEGDVMAMVQQLRREAADAGTLRTTEQQVVRRQNDYLLIEPANPQVVYVPYYDPYYAYGTWGYPGYDPYFFGGPAYVGRPGLYFGSSSFILSMFWGWSDWDWGYRRLRIYPDRYNRINYRRPPVTSRDWYHDPYHRRGVIYHNVHVRERYGRHDGRGDRDWSDRNRNDRTWTDRNRTDRNRTDRNWQQDRDRSADWDRMRERNPEFDRSTRRSPDWQGRTPRGQDVPTMRDGTRDRSGYRDGAGRDGAGRDGGGRHQGPRSENQQPPIIQPSSPVPQTAPVDVSRQQAPAGMDAERRARTMELVRERQQNILEQRRVMQQQSPAVRHEPVVQQQPERRAPAMERPHFPREREARPEPQAQPQAQPQSQPQSRPEPRRERGNWREGVRPN